MDLFEPGIRKVSATFTFSEESLALQDGFERKGHVEYDPITDEDRKNHASAKLALEVLNETEWVDMYEFDYTLHPLERKRWVADETVEEWLERYRRAKADGWKPKSWTDKIRPWATATKESHE